MFTKGILGKKLGMTSVFEASGRALGVTAIQAGPCYVTQVKTVDKDGYSAVQVGFSEVKRLKLPEAGHVKPVGRNLKHLQEFREEAQPDIQVGQVVDVGIFKPGDLVDIVGVSKGKGFAGGVKRYHFRGGPKTHGQSDRHRAPGSVGGTTHPGRVWKGTRMAGHLGNRQATSRRLLVVRADPASNLLVVRGAVPGATGSLVSIRAVAGAA